MKQNLSAREVAKNLIMVAEPWAMSRGYSRAEGITAFVDLLAAGKFDMHEDGGIAFWTREGLSVENDCQGKKHEQHQR